MFSCESVCFIQLWIFSKHDSISLLEEDKISVKRVLNKLVSNLIGIL